MSWTRLISMAVALAATASAWADETANRPSVDQSALPAIEKGWAGINPYRGVAAAIEAGAEAYAQTCARCHGPQADSSGFTAPDLRRLDLGCRRIRAPDLRAACLADNDAYFSKTVREGKTIVGIVHMPAWEKALGPKLTWAIRSYIESRPPPAHLHTSAEAAQGEH